MDFDTIMEFEMGENRDMSENIHKWRGPLTTSMIASASTFDPIGASFVPFSIMPHPKP